MARVMKAFVMKGIGQVGFMEKPVPEPIIRTTRALICTSDIHTYRPKPNNRATSRKVAENR